MRPDDPVMAMSMGTGTRVGAASAAPVRQPAWRRERVAMRTMPPTVSRAAPIMPSPVRSEPVRTIGPPAPAPVFGVAVASRTSMTAWPTRTPSQVASTEYTPAGVPAGTVIVVLNLPSSSAVTVVVAITSPAALAALVSPSVSVIVTSAPGLHPWPVTVTVPPGWTEPGVMVKSSYCAAAGLAATITRSSAPITTLRIT